jgi:hypothetical protein
MIVFKLGRRKSIKERKLALISRINQINSQLHNVGGQINKKVG